MGYRILADTILLIHGAWVLFVCLGLVAAVKLPVVAWIHGGALTFTLFLNIAGWHCPLTVLENHLLGVLQVAEGGYHGSFVAHYLVPLVYPDLPEKTIRIGVSLFVTANLAGHGILCSRKHRKGTEKSGSQDKGRRG